MRFLPASRPLPRVSPSLLRSAPPIVLGKTRWPPTPCPSRRTQRSRLTPEESGRRCLVWREAGQRQEQSLCLMQAQAPLRSPLPTTPYHTARRSLATQANQLTHVQSDQRPSVLKSTLPSVSLTKTLLSRRTRLDSHLIIEPVNVRHMDSPNQTCREGRVWPWCRIILQEGSPPQGLTAGAVLC